MKYFKFGYEEGDKQITTDGELLASLGFVLSDYQKAETDSQYERTMWQVFLNSGGDDGHSGYSWSCVRSVAAVLVKHNWKTVAEIPEDDPLHERVKVA